MASSQNKLHTDVCGWRKAKNRNGETINETMYVYTAFAFMKKRQKSTFVNPLRTRWSSTTSKLSYIWALDGGAWFHKFMRENGRIKVWNVYVHGQAKVGVYLDVRTQRQAENVTIQNARSYRRNKWYSYRCHLVHIDVLCVRIKKQRRKFARAKEIMRVYLGRRKNQARMYNLFALHTHNISATTYPWHIRNNQH